MSFKGPESAPLSLEGEPFDISEDINKIMNGDSKAKSVLLSRYVNEQDYRPSLKLVLDYTTLAFANWVKHFVSNGPEGQTRTAAIRATEKQAKEAANVFASGVDWIQKED